MIYVDTGCLLKLYYPEPESLLVAGLVAGRPIALSSVHELELSNALELKLFRKEARPAQVNAIHALVEEDTRSGVLYRPTVVWEDVLHQATALAKRYNRKLGCRSLDIIHCSIALSLSATSFITTDKKQRRFATTIGLSCPAIRPAG